jgi:AbrB family looped-hinge helix DNA binding protein
MISSKGQLTVPLAIREALGLRAGTAVVFERRPEGVLLRKKVTGVHPVDQAFGSLRLKESVDETLEAMRGPGPSRARPRRGRR